MVWPFVGFKVDTLFLMAQRKPKVKQANLSYEADLAEPGRFGANGAAGSYTSEELLLQELGDVGRNDKSIQPSALERHRILLDCPAVESRVTPNASDADRARVTEQAIRDAIAALPTPLERLVGKAILGVGDKFEGFTVNERIRTLDELKTGCTPDTFKRRRPKVLKQIAKYLEQPHVRPGTRLITLASHQTVIKSVECVTTDVMRLSYYLQAYRLVLLLDEKLAEVKDPPYNQDRSALTGEIYKVYLDLVLSAGYCFARQPYSQRSTLEANLAPSLLTHFSSLIDVVLNEMPFDTNLRNAICSLHFDGYDLLDYRKFMDLVRRYCWQRWADGVLDFGDLSWSEQSEDDYGPIAVIDTDIDLLIQTSRDIIEKAYDCWQIKPDEDDIRVETTFIIAMHYGVSPWKQEFLGYESLFNFVSHYLETGKLPAEYMVHPEDRIPF